MEPLPEARRNARERNAAEQLEAAQAQPEPAQAAGAEQLWSSRKRKADDMLEDVEARPTSMEAACKEGEIAAESCKGILCCWASPSSVKYLHTLQCALTAGTKGGRSIP